MASKDRMIVPFVCTECGAPLNRKILACEFCRVEWEMVKRYSGPEVPDDHNRTLLTSTQLGSSCSYPTMISMGCETSIPIHEMGSEHPVGYITPAGEVVYAE